jgi:hypothetical protein
VNASLSIDQVKKSQAALRTMNEIVKMNYRDTSLNKLQLLELRRMLLDKCDEIIDASEYPFQRYNLRTQKVFNDLVQYSLDPHSSIVRQSQSNESVGGRGNE